MKVLEAYKDKKNDHVLRSMIDYMNFGIEEEMDDFDCGYTQAAIDKCGKILDNYIDDLINAQKDAKLIIKAVKKVIKKLNKLNEKWDETLIETDQREDLCPFIENAAVLAGLPKPEDDITLKWREW